LVREKDGKRILRLRKLKMRKQEKGRGILSLESDLSGKEKRLRDV
jgi:hypothetical protein